MFDAAKYPELFHYTNLHGLNGILKSACLRATHFTYLNDTTELQQLRKPFSERLAQRIPSFLKEKKLLIKAESEQGVQNLFKAEAERWERIIHGAFFMNLEPFIASFCFVGEKVRNKNFITQNGLLSQWKSYGMNGVAIVFDSAKISELIEVDRQNFVHAGYDFLPVLYNGQTDSDFESELKKLFDVILENIEHEISDKKLPDDQTKSYLPFVHCLSRLKHEAFEEENEARVVFIRPKDKDVPKNKRQKNVTDGTFFKKKRHIELFSRSPALFRSSINRIIIGPGKHADSLCSKLQRKYKNYRFVKADIPYIPQG